MFDNNLLSKLNFSILKKNKINSNFKNNYINIYANWAYSNFKYRNLKIKNFFLNFKFSNIFIFNNFCNYSYGLNNLLFFTLSNKTIKNLNIIETKKIKLNNKYICFNYYQTYKNIINLNFFKKNLNSTGIFKDIENMSIKNSNF
jgi:hypothetical protein